MRSSASFHRLEIFDDVVSAERMPILGAKDEFFIVQLSDATAAEILQLQGKSALACGAADDVDGAWRVVSRVLQSRLKPG